MILSENYKNRIAELAGIFKENGRELGKKLSDQVGKKNVWVYRAVGLDETSFKQNDYITQIKKFAVDHAENNHIYNEEQQQVIKALISTDNIYNANNPGEYFYSGPDIKGQVIYLTKGLDYEGFEELTRKDFLSEDEQVAPLNSSSTESEFNKYGDLKIANHSLYVDGKNVGDAHIDFTSTSDTHKYLKLYSIRLLNHPRGQGIGTQFMQQLFKMADANNYIIILTPSNINKSRLERWYKSLGFIFNKGRKKDFLHRELMYRMPK